MSVPAPTRVLILGGTTEASSLARSLAARSEIDVISSLAGRTTNPRSLPGAVRVGGFGGALGLARYLGENNIDLLIDATHPFAAEMPLHAAKAAARAGLPRLRVERPGWIPADGDDWRPVPDLAAAANEAGRFDRVLITTGRRELQPFTFASGTWFLVRCIEPPDPMPLANAEVLLDRGPFTISNEHDLLRRHRIEAVVTKDSGGDATSAKLVAARLLDLPVIMVQRPAPPPGPLVTTVGDALAWISGQMD